QAADMVGAERGCGALHGSTRRHCERSEAISPSLAHAFADGDCFGALRAPRNDIYPHTSFERSTIIFSFAHCSSSASTLPSSVEAKPHCGESASWSSATDFVASSRRRLMSSFFSRLPNLEVTSPSTTILLPLGRNRSGSKPPARSVSYSRK